MEEAPARQGSAPASGKNYQNVDGSYKEGQISHAASGSVEYYTVVHGSSGAAGGAASQEAISVTVSE